MKDTNPKDAIASSKVPLWLLSPIAKAAWALAMHSGSVKYGSWNWRAAGVRASVYLSAAQRHLDAYLSGEEHDPVDGTHHLGNVMACCAILLDAKAAGKLSDDRPPSVSLRPTYAECEPLVVKLAKQYEDKKPRHYTIADTRVEETKTLQVGDRVRVLPGCGVRPGREGTITRILSSCIDIPFVVAFDCLGEDELAFAPHELEVAL